MVRPNRLAALYLAGVFVAGAVFGFVANSLYTMRAAAPNRPGDPKQVREQYVSNLQKDLALTPEQLAQVTAILDDTNQRFRELREKMDPEFAAIRESQRQRIMALLTPEQQPRYQKVLEDHRLRRQKHHRR